MLQKYSTWNVASVFFKYPTQPHNIKEISRSINLAHTSVMLCVNQLLKDNLIVRHTVKQGKRVFPIYTANMGAEFKNYKKMFNHLSLRQSGLIDHLVHTFAPKCIILFGSFELGEDTETSDIDIFIQAHAQDIPLQSFEKALGHPIQLHCNPRFEKYDVELKNNIGNGTVLSGYLMLYK